MEIIGIILFDNKSGGNLQLNYLFKKLCKRSNKNSFLILIKNKKIKFNNLTILIKKLFKIYLSNDDLMILYSDPFLSFFELLPNSKKVIRFVQSIDEELYNNHPKLPKIFQYLLNKLIKIFNLYGNNTIYVCSNLCSAYMKSYKRKISFIKPTLTLIKNDIQAIKNSENSIRIVSIMSNPESKGISCLRRMSVDFPELKFTVITNKNYHNLLNSNITYKNNLSREEIFDILINSFCHISFSSKESLGLPIYEAMASNIPSIFKLNQSNLYLIKNELLYFKKYEKKIFINFFKICKNRSSRLDLINNQKKIVSKNFSIDYMNKY